jgi:hypothetical protein
MVRRRHLCLQLSTLISIVWQANLRQRLRKRKSARLTQEKEHPHGVRRCIGVHFISLTYAHALTLTSPRDGTRAEKHQSIKQKEADAAAGCGDDDEDGASSKEDDDEDGAIEDGTDPDGAGESASGRSRPKRQKPN